MSAPTALESGALARGIARLTRPKRTKRAARTTTGDRRSATAIALLGREHDDLCRQASDPLEIAAVLEAAGLTDSQARSRYRAAGVFEVAEQLWQQVPWRPAPSGDRVERWQLPLWRSQLRGLLYAVPAVIAAVIPARADGGLDYAVLAVGTAVAIAFTQGLSVLGHVLHGRGQTRALAQLATLALGGVAGLTVLGAAASALARGSVAAVLAPGGQLLFVVAATLLLVAGLDRLLAALVAPGILAVAVQLAGVHRLPAGLAVAGAATVLLVASGTWLRVGRGGTGDGVRSAIGRVELSHAAVAACYGLGLSALVTYAVVGFAAGRVTGAGGWVLLATLPLTATIGLCEYLLHRARRRCTAALAGARRLHGGFTATARTQLRLMVATQAGAVVLVAGAVLLALRWLDAGPAVLGSTAGYAAGYSVLALALALTTTLMSLGYAGLAASLAGAAGAALLVLDVLPGLAGTALVLAQLGVVAVLFLTAYRVTVTRFVTVSVHR